MMKIWNLLFNIIKKLIITIVLIPFAILLGILMYSEALFVVIFYLWVKPEKAEELWHEFIKGLKDFKEKKKEWKPKKPIYHLYILIAIIVLLWLARQFFK